MAAAATDEQAMETEEFRLDPACRPAARRCGPGDPFVCEGRIAVEALMASPLGAGATVFLEAGRHEDLGERIALAGGTVTAVPRPEIERLAGFAFHRGVLATGVVPPAMSVGAWRGGTPEGRGARRIAVVCGLADGANVGALVRNAAAFGCDAVAVALDSGASPWTRKAIRASAGTLFRLPVLMAPDLAGDLAGLAAEGWRVLATVADSGAPPLESLDPDGTPVAVLFGNEGHGLAPEWLALATSTVRIPLAPGVESLNVASASAVVLHHLRPRERGAT